MAFAYPPTQIDGSEPTVSCPYPGLSSEAEYIFSFKPDCTRAFATGPSCLSYEYRLYFHNCQLTSKTFWTFL